MPRPVVRDGNGKLVRDYLQREWFLKLLEEISEVLTATDKNNYAEEVADVITVCVSMLESLGYDEKARSELFAKVNTKNEKRGYFKEC